MSTMDDNKNPRLWTNDPCQVEVEIDLLTKEVILLYSEKAMQNPIQVQWEEATGGAPTECDGNCVPSEGFVDGRVSERCRCPAVVEVTAVFAEVPTEAELEQHLRLGALPPTMGCTHGCD